jgi:hypothetical protein
VAALWVLCGAPSIASAVCIGDCNGDGMVTIDELITAVNIALGLQPLSACPAVDGGGDGQVTIDDLIRAVDSALNGCPATPTATPSNQLVVTGGCAQPGPHGLVPCDEGLVVVVWRCNTPATCLAQLAARSRLGDGPVGSHGGFSIRVDAASAANAELLLEAPVAAATLYRTMGLGPAGDAGSLRLGPIAAQSLELSVGMINPGSEAGVRLLDQHGLENFVPGGVPAVIDAAQTANANTVFDGVDPAAAADKAEAVAQTDPTVQEVIASSLFTPTPTGTATVTATPPATVTASRTATASRTPTVPSTATATSTSTETTAPSATPTQTPTPFLTAQISTNHGCIEAGDNALYDFGEPITVSIRIDGSSDGMPIDRAHFTLVEIVETQVVRGPLVADDVPTGQDVLMQLDTIPPVGTHAFVLQAGAATLGAEAQCSVQVASVSCTTACDCTPGLSCVDSTCMQTGSLLYCCGSAACPIGAVCQLPTGDFSNCGV